MFTLMRPWPADAANCALSETRSKVHGRPVWAIVARCPLTATLPEREAIWGFASTFAVKLASPCPEAVLNRIHDASLVDVQVQSRVVDTLTVTDPPSGPTACGSAVSNVWQRVSDGLVNWLTLVEPQASAAAVEIATTSARNAPGNSRP